MGVWNKKIWLNKNVVSQNGLRFMKGHECVEREEFDWEVGFTPGN